MSDKMKVLGYRELKNKYPDCPEFAPFDLLNEEHAMRIHGQSLKRLNERGGMSPLEMITNIEKLPFYTNVKITESEGIKKLLKYLETKAG
jgi:hypothetical protein